MRGWKKNNVMKFVQQDEAGEMVQQHIVQI
jgi:hypothetical protein